MGDDDTKFKRPFSCIVSGPNKLGVTCFCIRLLQHFDALCTEREFGSVIIVCYSETNDVPERQHLPSNTKYQ